jgi:hypothetical protein
MTLNFADTEDLPVKNPDAIDSGRLYVITAVVDSGSQTR